MLKNSTPLFLIVVLLLFSCQSGEEKEKTANYKHPEVSQDGRTIFFKDEKIFLSFETETLERKDETAFLKAPGRVVANVYGSTSASQNMVLFDDRDLSEHYMALRRNQIDISRLQNVEIKQKEEDLERLQELQKLGSATGKEVLRAETELAIAQSELENLKAEKTEHQIQLKSGGFIADKLQQAPPGTAYLISDVPERQIDGVLKGAQTCHIVFTAYPQDTLIGNIKGITDRIDRETRMMKIRMLVDNSSGKIKTGMFAKVYFSQSYKNVLSLPQSALVTVKGTHYVFVKKPDYRFQRQQVRLGPRMDDRIVVEDGVQENQEIVVRGAMLLKGLSFGY